MDPALAAWRRKATDVLLIASAAAHLPVVVLMSLGYGPPAAWPVNVVFLATYVVMAASAVSFRLDCGVRLRAYFTAAYVAVAFGHLSLPHGPYAQVGLVANPVLVLVLRGPAAARVAVAASAAILVAAPFLRALPGVATALGLDPALVAGPQSLVWFRSIAVGAFLAALMVLLDRFHRFLLETLATERQAVADLEREVVERIAAQRKMEHEMRERQRLEREIAAVGDEERRRLGQELHDGVCQELTAALLRCKAVERCLERGGAASTGDLAPLSSMLADTIDEAHNVALGLCPLEPEPDALAPALRALTRRIQEMANVRCEFLAAGDVRVSDPAVAQHLYRIAQEALSNAVRHAKASRIAAELRGSDHELSLRVQDNGVGLPADTRPGGMGMRTMAYRAQILEGKLTVTPAPGGGTCVACCVPRPATSAAASSQSGDESWIPA